MYPVLVEFDKSILKYPNIKRSPGGASTELFRIFKLRLKEQIDTLRVRPSGG
jgi:arylsulfatase